MMTGPSPISIRIDPSFRKKERRAPPDPQRRNSALATPLQTLRQLQMPRMGRHKALEHQSEGMRPDNTASDAVPLSP